MTKQSLDSAILVHATPFAKYNIKMLLVLIKQFPLSDN